MKNFTITEEYDFDHLIETKINNNHKDYLSWPIVYFLKNKKTKAAYVGETTDVLTRINTHLKSEEKKQLSSANLILSDLFHKSATLDLESNLIKYISADGQYTLQNGNLGISNHQYHEKKVYWDLFKDIWDELIQLGISRHSLDFINNSDLFKYSPYKSLSKEQIKGLKMILNCLLDENAKVSLIHGGAGTGKSILAIFLFKLLKTNLEDFNYADFDEDDEDLFLLLKRVKNKFKDLNMALVIPMASFRKTISNVFKNVNGLSGKMVIGPSDLAKNKYDLIIVDEGHRLRRRVNLGSYFGTFDINCEKLGLDKSTASELDWVILQSNKSIIFYDQYQSIKPSDTLKESFKKLELAPSTRVEKLKTQLRVRGGNNYIKLIHKIFDTPSTLSFEPYKTNDYEFYLFDDLSQMIDKIKKKNELHDLSRMVAGYAWEWVSSKNPEAYDIIIGENQLKWNSVSVDWVNSPNSINEVGCIHTTQGYDLNYTGVIIGPELDYDFVSGKFIIDKQKYKDKNGKNSIKNEEELLGFIINIYKTILLRGIEGTYIYACNENLRRFLQQFIPSYNPSSTDKKLIKISNIPTESSIPFYDLNIAAGSFSELQELEKVKYIELDSIENRDDYFACTVIGESMNKIIPNGSICLFKKYNGGSRNGLITLVEGRNIADLEFGSNYTIKEYSSKKLTDDEGWHHEEIILLPKSNDFNFEPIVLRDEEIVDFKVLGIFVKVLKV
ncbi:DNA/RNA helicase domain-containing protein [Chryseobacterium culicis]|uniref:GIY-YIG domain-containing protein n=1 Tax=Chryseobacterium culicis TaxID=680127 RepID=A0A2S9D070_CHRCI|nr:DNA/RNA helicase domain-containing protein [Chryseobacterium culicis]PRB86168.1 hypothetical protein CQ022_07930 [Chryseobacterium culicis]PRB91921.1 hypothetical protein CQ033_01600 [Chryseobacterium culicis]